MPISELYRPNSLYGLNKKYQQRIEVRMKQKEVIEKEEKYSK